MWSSPSRIVLALWFVGAVGIVLADGHVTAQEQPSLKHRTSLPFAAGGAAYTANPPLRSYKGLFVFRDDTGDAYYIISADGSEWRRLVPSLDWLGIAWSPDGRYFVHHSPEPDGYSVNLLDLRTGETRHIIDGVFAWLQWSPDNQWVHFFDGFHFYIYSVRDGTLRTFSNTRGSRHDLVWAPDSRTVAWWEYTGQPGMHRLWVLPITETEPRLAYIGGMYDQDDGRMAWSPDGSRLLFEARNDLSDPNDVIYETDREGSPATPLVPGHGPNWVDGGSRVLLARDQDGFTNLYLASADGSSTTLFVENTRDWSVAPTGDRILHASGSTLRLKFTDSSVSYSFGNCSLYSLRWSETGDLFACSSGTLQTLIASARAAAPGALYNVHGTRGPEFLPLSRNYMALDRYHIENPIPGYQYSVFDDTSIFGLSDGSMAPLPIGRHKILEWRYMP